jgi:plasmid maintenance system killer protein
MSIEENGFINKGLALFWKSGGTNHSGIQPSFAKVLRLELVHLDTAVSLSDILGGYGKTKSAKLLTGHTDRYSMEINGNWRLTFSCSDPLTGVVSKIDIEDLHRPGGAKHHK